MENQEKEGKIAKIEFKSEFKKQDGKTNYYHNTFFEDGTEGQSVLESKLPDAWAVGKTVKYKVYSNENGTKFYPVREKTGGFKKTFNPAAEERRQKMIAKQSSIKIAFDYLITIGKNPQATMKDVYVLADEITNWVMS